MIPMTLSILLSFTDVSDFVVGYEGLRPAEAYKFGATYQSALANLRIAEKILSDARTEARSANVKLDQTWEDWQIARIACWRALADALNRENHPNWRAYRLAVLRQELIPFGLGRYSYWSFGWMPTPTPD
ncbi:MAG: hypothetical protein N2112_09075 [Gemmataceae bacterium]|jgi:hypothetical protein|nr:hypothetical protein [Gemmataceae bacterium]